MNKSGPRAIVPTSDEIAATPFHWKYDQRITDVTTVTDPPNSVPPLINIQRRIVGEWENVND